MSEARKITANLPREALARAQRLTGIGSVVADRFDVRLAARKIGRLREP